MTSTTRDFRFTDLHNSTWCGFQTTGFGSDKNLRVFADTIHRCKAISTPTVCAMPVLSMIYLEEIDEIVTGGIGVIQPWKIRLSTSLKSSQSDETNASTRGRRGSLKLHGGISQPKNNEGFGPGRQMLQALAPYSCNLLSDDWVFHMKVYRGKSSLYGGKQRLLAAICHEAVFAIDYMNRCQLWAVRLHDPQANVFDGFAKRQLTSDEPNEASKSLKRNNSLGKTYHVTGHVSLTRCDFFPRFGYFVTGGGEGTIRIMHMVNFGLVQVLRGHLSSITGLIAHPHFPLLISASSDGSIRVWCLETFTMTQRIDTGQKIENLHICPDSKFIYFHSKQQVTLYRLTNVYSLYTVLHSPATQLTKIEGVPQAGIPGKVLASLEDGSVAILSPVTGLPLTMIYPMTTFQVFTNMTFDPFNNIAYVRLNGGHVMECNCSTNPSLPVRRYAPTFPYDQDVHSLTSLVLTAGRREAVSAVFAGLRNGQITLVHPNSLRFQTMQAHTGSVRFISPIEKSLDSCYTPDNGVLSCHKNLISVGSTTVRTWRVISVADQSGGGGQQVTVRLEPELKVTLPPCMANPARIAVLRDRLCVCNVHNRIFVLVLKSSVYKNAATRRMAISNLAQTTKELARIKYGTSRFGNRASIAPIDECDSLKSHHHDDEHTSCVTSLASSSTLNCFASSGEDGYLKIWDEENRLLREVCFAPHRPTALCFPNDRDLVVALEGRVCLIDLSTFMTRQLIRDRNIYDLTFIDDVSEDAISYDDDIRTTNNIFDLPSVPLEASERKIRQNTKLRPEQSQETLQSATSLENNSINHPVKQEAKRQVESMARRRWKNAIQTVLEGIVSSSVSKANESVPKEVLKDEGCKISQQNEDIGQEKETTETNICLDDNVENQPDFKIEESPEQNETHLPDNNESSSQEGTRYTKIVEYEGLFRGEIARRVLESKYPIAPDGYIQNSVIRQRVRPPTPKIKTIAEWKLLAVPDAEARSRDELSSFGESESSTTESGFLFESEYSDSFRLSDISSFSSLPDSSNVGGSKESSPDLGLMPSLDSQTQEVATKKVIFFQDIQEREEVHIRMEEAQLKDSEQPKRNLAQKVPLRASQSDLSASLATVQRAQPANTLAAARRDDLKQKLKEQRQTAVTRAEEAKTAIPKVLKEIVSAPWFRKKLEVVTPDTVMEGLLELGDTLRLVAHEKAIEGMLVLYQEYPVRIGGGEANLSPDTIVKVQNHLAKYLKPSYDAANDIAGHPNRTKLADNALDAVISGLPASDVIQLELFRLLADEDESLREKAKLILEVKFGIDSWAKLCEELEKATGGGKLIPDPEERVRNERGVMKSMEDRIEKGEITIATAPRLAERFGFEVIQAEPKKPSQADLKSRRSSSIFGKSITSVHTLRQSDHSQKRRQSQEAKNKSVKFKKTEQKQQTSRARQRQRDEQQYLQPHCDQPSQQGAIEVVPRPKINWEKAIPPKSVERRRMSKLIQLMEKLNLGVYEGGGSSKTYDERFSRAETRLLPPLATRIFSTTQLEREESPVRETRDRFPLIPSAARISRESKKDQRSNKIDSVLKLPEQRKTEKKTLKLTSQDKSNPSLPAINNSIQSHVSMMSSTHKGLSARNTSSTHASMSLSGTSMNLSSLHSFASESCTSDRDVGSNHVTSNNQSLTAVSRESRDVLSRSFNRSSFGSLQRISALKVIHKMSQSYSTLKSSDNSLIFESQPSISSCLSNLRDIAITSSHLMATESGATLGTPSTAPGSASDFQDSGFVERIPSSDERTSDNEEHGSFCRRKSQETARMEEKHVGRNVNDSKVAGEFFVDKTRRAEKDQEKINEEDLKGWRDLLQSLKAKRMRDNGEVKGISAHRPEEVNCIVGRATGISAGERIATCYSLHKDNRCLSTNLQFPCSPRLPPTNKGKHAAGESRYGIMSIHWLDGDGAECGKSPAMTPRLCLESGFSFPRSTYAKENRTSGVDSLPQTRDVSRGKRLSELLNKVRTKEREMKKRVRKEAKLDEKETRITTSNDGKTLLRLKIPSCVTTRESPSCDAKMNWGTKAPPSTPMAGF